MFRRFVLVSAVFVAMCALLSCSNAMAQSKEEGKRLFNEAKALKEKAPVSVYEKAVVFSLNLARVQLDSLSAHL